MVGVISVLIIFIVVLFYLAYALDELLKWRSEAEKAYNSYEISLEKAEKNKKSFNSDRDEMHNDDLSLEEAVRESAIEYNREAELYNKRINKIWIRGLKKALKVKEMDKLKVE